MTARWLPVALLAAALSWIPAAVQDVRADDRPGPVLCLGPFSRQAPGEAMPSGWQPMTFDKVKRHTTYRLVADQGATVVQAVSDRSASGWILHRSFDPQRWPFLSWWWKVPTPLVHGNLEQKSGDDYAARIYVTFALDRSKVGWWQRLRHDAASKAAGRPLPGSALTYVWSGAGRPGAIFSNPYADQVKMVLVQAGSQNAGRWVREVRNLVADYRRAFGTEPPAVTGVAIMTDTDNTGATATAWYGDILAAPDMVSVHEKDCGLRPGRITPP